MYGYVCHTCGGLCDTGEIENGVCYDCRVENMRRKEQHNLQVRKELNRLIRARYAEQPDGQMVTCYGK